MQESAHRLRGRQLWHPRRWGPWAAGTVVLSAAALVVIFATASVPSHARPVNAGDITFGPANAMMVIIEYSDFECRFCPGYSQILDTLRDQYRDQVLFVFRFFPSENHPNGLISAQAAYAAYLQGRFWEMHDLLFRNQERWSGLSDPTSCFEAYAQTLGLDIGRFRSDLTAAGTVAFISAQETEGKSAGVEHTPWFVVDGMEVQPRSIEDFQRLMKKAP